VVGETLSPERNLSVGVPQGSVLSPLLFLLYISDIGEWIESATITGYADDIPYHFKKGMVCQF
jgi:hypothetical protein